MSTVVVVCKGGMVAVGADTMTKYGDIKESADYIENASKIMQVGDNYFAYVGHASGCLVWNSYFDSLDSIPKMRNPREIYEMVRVAHKSLKDNYFINPHEDDEDPYESSQFDSLIANPYGIFGLYSLRSVQQYKRFYAFGTGTKFALGAMHTVYDSYDSVEEIARVGLSAGAEFDDSSGLPLEVYSVPLINP